MLEPSVIKEARHAQASLMLSQVYQLGRAFTAVTLQASTVDTAREHALQVIHMEQRLGIFIEPGVQRWFLAHPALMRWTNWTYSFIHIPGTILYLIVLYHLTTARPRQTLQEEPGCLAVAHGPAPQSCQSESAPKRRWGDLGPGPQFGLALYERRRRTMAVCNLLAFVVFTFWPCMPPRLLSDPAYTGEHAKEARSYGFVDTVHAEDGAGSVWTTNRFCNQYGAFPLSIYDLPLCLQVRSSHLPLAGIVMTNPKISSFQPPCHPCTSGTRSSSA